MTRLWHPRSSWCAALALALLACLSACTVGPRYRRPPVSAPPVFRDDTQPDRTGGKTTLGDLAWHEMFTDHELQQLMQLAFERNFDLRLAAGRIEQARAALGIARSHLFPDAGMTVAETQERVSQAGVLPGAGRSGDLSGRAVSAELGTFWELDFWGKYRRGTEAARARLLATEAGWRAVAVSLVSTVATAYFRLRELDAELEVTEDSLAVRRQSLELTRILLEGGVASRLEVRQAETLVSTAVQTKTRLEQAVREWENELSLLLGESPRDQPRGLRLTEQVIPSVPPGLPSSLLERRPDIIEAEQNVAAAYADIGVARANFFPSISLTAAGGTESSALGSLFSGVARTWFFQPALNLPIFNAGRLRSLEQQAAANAGLALTRYEYAIQAAFRDVSNALIARTKSTQLRIEQEKLAEIAQSAADLSKARYEGGVTDYLEVLDSERTSLSARLDLARARLDELLASVRLYAALGGGWQ